MAVWIDRLRGVHRFLGRLAIAAAWVFAVGLILWNLLRLYPGDRWLLVRLGNFFAPWLFMALVPALLVALLGGRRWLAQIVLLLTLVFAVRYWPLLFPRLLTIKAESGGSELRVMTFNVNYANRNVSSIAQLIRSESPDVIAMQEMVGELAVPLREELKADYPYFVVGESNSWALGVASRYPLTAQPAWNVGRAQQVVVETPGGPLTLWNIHPTTALSQGGWRAQQKTLAAVAQAVEAEENPVIVLGDFNTTDQTENYRLLAHRLTDVHWAVGRGFAFTFPDFRRYRLDWPWLRPMVGIDHIFASEHLLPQETHVIPSGVGSDHLPVVATLRFVER